MVYLAFVSLAGATDVDLFDPAASFPSGRGTPQGESPELGDPGFAGGILGAYARDPARLGPPGGPSEVAVASILPVTVHAGWTVGEAMRFDALFPGYLHVDSTIAGSSGPAAGDLRIQATIPVPAGAMEAAVIPGVGLPTGVAGSVVSQGSSASLTLALGGRNPTGGYVVDLGLTAANDQPLEASGPSLGSAAQALAGAWLGGERLRIGAEVDLDLGLSSAERSNLASSGHGFVQGLLPSGIGLAAGGGAGLADGIGSPRWRVFAALTYASLVRDADRDGVVDKADACPLEAEDPDGFEDPDGCPDPDNDGDRLSDAVDRCPDAAEDSDGHADQDGCPDDDNDGDRIPDAQDRCPDIRGAITYAGCPDIDGDGVPDPDDSCPRDAGPLGVDGCPDRDGDRIPDARDACPTRPAPKGEDPSFSDGCPKVAYLAGGEIRLAERIEFDAGRATLIPESDRVLEAVARVLLAHPGVRSVEIQGHTDDVGAPEANLRLSQERAEAVVAWLVRRGIEPGRLTARGYGETAPLFTNRTPKGRESNQRIQLVILEGGPEAAPPPPVLLTVVPAAAPVQAGGPPGLLSVSIAGGYWATVLIDGEKLSRAAPFADLPIPAGRHTIRAENLRQGLAWEVTVDVASEQRVKLVVPIPER